MESKDAIRQHLLIIQSVQRDSQDRLRRLQDDVDVQQQRREELERILLEKDAAYEDLLGACRHLLTCSLRIRLKCLHTRLNSSTISGSIGSGRGRRHQGV